LIAEQISREVARIKGFYGEADPFKLSRAMHIQVLNQPLGNRPGVCKGFYLEHSRIPCIVINSDLPEVIQRIILAHELGHAVLHRKAKGFHSFNEFSLFDDTSRMEYEANLFAAELLLDDHKVLDTLNQDVSFSGAAALLRVPVELLDFKFRAMKRRNYMIVDSPLASRSNFLKDIEVPEGEVEGE